MKTKQQIGMRMEFLALGERMGYPRLPYALGQAVRQGEGWWLGFAGKAPLTALSAALRNAKTLEPVYAQPKAPASEPVDDKRQRILDNLAKARAARAAKRQEATA